MDERVRKIIDKSRRVVFFGGAGVSTESNIPDFRSETGLYNAMRHYGYSPEEMLSSDFYHSRKELFFDYYKNNLIYRDARPNKAHIALARLEEEGKLLSVVTQNIDGLHQAAGSKEVLELHGSVHRNYCMKCGKSYDAEYMLHAEGVPTCSCGGRIKPDVVLYEEGLDMTVMARAIQAIQDADMLIIGGTSLIVYPAAGLIDYYRGNKLVVINMSVTSQDKNADLVIQEPIGKVFAGI